MYKLFLCLRYLHSRVIAYFAMLAVALCVAMMLIVISVMNGFLHKIELAAKGLFGDIVVESSSLSGLGNYDEFIQDVKTNLKDEVAAGSPFIITYGILDVPHTDHRQTVQIAGIRLPERAKVSDFANGLYFEKNLAQPTFDPPISELISRLGDVQRETGQIAVDIRKKAGGKLSQEQINLLDRLDFARAMQETIESRLKIAQPYQAKLAQLQKQIDVLTAKGPAANQANLDKLTEEQMKLSEQVGFASPDRRVILGLGLSGFSFRTPDGQTVRIIGPGRSITLTLIPLGRRAVGDSDLKPTREEFSIVDDCRTDVSSIDSNIVYLPFETLQRVNNMGAQYDFDTGKQALPARTSQIHFKANEGFEDNASLERIAGKIDSLWVAFQRSHPDSLRSGNTIYVQTWRQRQAHLVGQIASQRTLVVIMFAIISMVSVVLIFVIFYMIVFQKTKDIGVMKAIGGSSGGVAWIFLMYGAAIGFVGAVMGTVGGYFFVKNINPIHDWVGSTFGFTVWNREWFMFDRIPGEIEPMMALLVVIGAVVAGLVGALAPAIRAARMQPVEALRYE